VAFVFLTIVRGVGTVELGVVQYEFWSSILLITITAPIFGTISGFAQILTEEKIYKRISIQKLLLLRFVYALLFIMALILVFYFLTKKYFGVSIGLIEFAFEPGSFAIYFYILTVDFVMVVLGQVNLLLGENNLGKLILGKFYDPREEERIFMFLDLRSSTQIAERLGHVQYSKMIQDCFNDLGVVSEYEAEIYQYVGDEVVLTWKMKAGLSNQSCIKAYFAFKRQLTDRQENYFQKYACRPYFKAGMNSGIVSVTEIGKYKKEIAYHGDSMNTASRIQNKCNELRQSLLISETLKNQLPPNGYDFTEMGCISLKGKEHEVRIFGVSEHQI